MKAGKKKKAHRKKTPASLTLSQEEKATLASLLEEPGNIDLSDLKTNLSSTKLACAFIEKLPTKNPQTPSILLAVKELFDQKDVQKALRKAAFKLKQSGIPVPGLEPEKNKGIIIRRIEAPEPSAYLGPIDGIGARAVFIIAPQIPKGVDVVAGVASDESGIMEFVANRFNRKQAEEFKKFFFERVKPMVETTPAHAVTVLENAYKKKEGASDESSRAYLKLRPWLLEHTELLDTPPLYKLIPQGGAPKENITDSQIKKLLEHELMATWIIDPEELEPMVEEIIKAEESPILISESQKQERINELKKEAIAKLYQHERRMLLKNRLEEMAYIFFKLEDEISARFSLAAANTLAEKESIFSENPFLMAILDRSLDYYPEAGQGEDVEYESPLSTPSSGIILPS